MRVLHAYNQHRGGGGANNATQATIEAARRNGLELESFARSSRELGQGLRHRVRAAFSAIHNRESVRRFAELLDGFRPDVVHAHELFPLVSPGVLPECTRRGVPVVMTVYDYRLTCPVVSHLRDGRVCTRCLGGREYWAVLGNCRGRLAESAAMALYSMETRRRRLFTDHVSRYVAPSEFVRTWLVEHASLPAERVVTINPAVEIPAAAADPGAGTYIAYAGRFSHEKGIDTLIEAQRRSGLPVRFARSHESLVTAGVLPAEADVVVTRTRDELASFYRGARVAVVPSRWYETFGLVGGEAMSHGIPLVASRIGALAGLFEDEVEGLHFEPGDAADLARKLERLWADPGLCRRLGAAARQRAREWDPQRHFERHLVVYEGARGASVARGRP